MKFIDFPALARYARNDHAELPSASGISMIVLVLMCVGFCRLNAFLDNVDMGEYQVHGDIEAYSCESRSELS